MNGARLLLAAALVLAPPLLTAAPGAARQGAWSELPTTACGSRSVLQELGIDARADSLRAALEEAAAPEPSRQSTLDKTGQAAQAAPAAAAPPVRRPRRNPCAQG